MRFPFRWRVPPRWLTSVLLAMVLLPLSGIVAFAGDGNGNNNDRCSVNSEDRNECGDHGGNVEPLGPAAPPGTSSGARGWATVIPDLAPNLVPNRTQGFTSVAHLGLGTYCRDANAGIDPGTGTVVVGSEAQHSQLAPGSNILQVYDYESKIDCPVGVEIVTTANPRAPLHGCRARDHTELRVRGIRSAESKLIGDAGVEKEQRQTPTRSIVVQGAAIQIGLHRGPSS